MLWKEAIQLTAKVHLFSFEFPVKEVCTCVQELGNWEGGEVIPASQERFINFHYARSTLKFWNMSLFWNLQELLKVSEWKEWSFFKKIKKLECFSYHWGPVFHNFWFYQLLPQMIYFFKVCLLEPWEPALELWGDWWKGVWRKLNEWEPGFHIPL